MIEIIPNWHPIFVHFTVALLLTAVGLHLVVRFINDEKLRSHLEVVAQWNLWLGTGITLLTVLMGVVAYNTVAHDTPSHEAMTEHRNWALVTASVFILLAVWSVLRARAGQGINTAILVGLLIGGGLLLSTAWHGGEAVYRFGLGVMSLPKTDSHDHGAAGHGDGAGNDHSSQDGTEQHSHDTSSAALQEDDVENCELPEKDEHAHDDGHKHDHNDAQGDHHKPHTDGESGSAKEDHHAHDDGEKGAHAH